MVSKTQWRAISAVLAVILLLASFMTGITGLTDNARPVSAVGNGYKAFRAELDALEENTKILSDGKAEYDEKKAAYDEQYAEYEKQLDEYNDANAKYNESVLGYNQQLIAYSVGKNQLNGSAISSIASGRQQLDSGWSAYNDGKQAYEQGAAEFAAKKQEYEQGKAAYEQLTGAIADLEDKHIPHQLALKLVSAQTGINITDEYLAQTKSQLDSAGQMIAAGEQQLADSKSQLDSAYSQLQQGESGLASAQQQVDAANAKLSQMKSEIDAEPEQLDADSKTLSETKVKLDAQKEELDAKADELAVYEGVQQKVERSRANLIDEGYGTEDSETAELLSAADKYADKLRGEYYGTVISFAVTYAAHIIAVLAAAAALILLVKNKASLSQKLVLLAVLCGVISVVASLFFGTPDTLAFAAAVFSAITVWFTQTTEE